MRLPVAIALTLVRRLIVYRLPRIVSDVDDPIGEPGNALRKARPGTQILLRLPGKDELGRVNRLVLVPPACTRSATASSGDQCDRSKDRGNEGRRDEEGWHRQPSIASGRSCSSCTL